MQWVSRILDTNACSLSSHLPSSFSSQRRNVVSPNVRQRSLISLKAESENTFNPATRFGSGLDLTSVRQSWYQRQYDASGLLQDAVQVYILDQSV